MPCVRYRRLEDFIISELAVEDGRTTVHLQSSNHLHTFLPFVLLARQAGGFTMEEAAAIDMPIAGLRGWATVNPSNHLWAYAEVVSLQ